MVSLRHADVSARAESHSTTDQPFEKCGSRSKREIDNVETRRVWLVRDQTAGRPFLLSIDNRSGVAELVLKLSRADGTQLKELRVSGVSGERNEAFDLAPAPID